MKVRTRARRNGNSYEYRYKIRKNIFCEVGQKIENVISDFLLRSTRVHGGQSFAY